MSIPQKTTSLRFDEVREGFAAAPHRRRRVRITTGRHSAVCCGEGRLTNERSGFDRPSRSRQTDGFVAVASTQSGQDTIRGVGHEANRPVAEEEVDPARMFAPPVSLMEGIEDIAGPQTDVARRATRRREGTAIPGSDHARLCVQFLARSQNDVTRPAVIIAGTREPPAEIEILARRTLTHEK